jgi:hypothetical protein
VNDRWIASLLPRPLPSAGPTAAGDRAARIGMEILFEVLFEAVLQIVLEILFELGIRRTKDGSARPASPWLAAFAYILLGAVAGGISLLLFPSLFLKTPAARYTNLLLTPLAAGAVMATLGKWRSHREHRLVRLDRFVYAYLFALTVAVVRVAFCK